MHKVGRFIGFSKKCCIKEPGIMVDLNYSYKMAQESGSKHGLIIIPGENPVRLAPFYTVWYPVPLAATTLDLTILNMFCAKDKHPVVSLMF